MGIWLLGRDEVGNALFDDLPDLTVIGIFNQFNMVIGMREYLLASI